MLNCTAAELSNTSPSNKHEYIENSIYQLIDAVDRFESFVDKISGESNSSTAPSNNTSKASLYEVLCNSGSMITEQSDRLYSLIEKLDSKLY